MSEQAWIEAISGNNACYNLEELQQLITYFSEHMDLMLPLSYREVVKLGDAVERYRDYEWKIGVIHHEIKVRLSLEPRQFGPWLGGRPFKVWDGKRFDGFEQRCRPCSTYSRKRRNPNWPLVCFRCNMLYPIESYTYEWSEKTHYRYADCCGCGFNPGSASWTYNIFDAERCKNCDHLRENTMCFDAECWLTSPTSKHIHIIEEAAQRTLCGGSLGQNHARWQQPDSRYREWRCPSCLTLLHQRETKNAPA